MGSTFIYIEKKGKKGVKNPGQILEFNELTKEREIVLGYEGDSIFSKIAKLPGGEYFVDDDYAAIEIGFGAVHWLISSIYGNFPFNKDREMKKDLERINNLARWV